jgi:lipoprotein-releasing system ATP-binding protein
MSDAPFIQAKELFRNYGTLPVLRGINLSIQKGEIVAVVGPSGAGKSTLLHILGTIDKPDKGSILYESTDVMRLSDRELSRFRNLNVGFVYQQHQLLPEFSARENVLLPAMIGNIHNRETEDYMDELFELMGVAERSHHRPSQLSGGEQQRFAVGRALINRPKVVLADEPSGNLDIRHARQLHDLFFTLRERYGQTFVIVTHNPELAERADRTLHLTDGQLDA